MGWSPFRKSKGSDLFTICLPSSYTPSTATDAAWHDWLQSD